MFKGKHVRAALAAVTLAFTPWLTGVAADERQSLEELRNTIINLIQGLVDQGVITREKAAQMVKSAQDKAAADAAAVAKSDEGAVRVPYVPQIVKDEIAKQVAEQVKPAVVADVVNEAKTEKWGVPGALADWLTRVRLYGDITVREEGLFYDKNNAPEPNYYGINTAGGVTKAGANAFLDTTEDRIRTRARVHLGVDADLGGPFTAGLRIATGNTTDLVSETQTIDGSQPFSFGLDELFIRMDQRTDQRFPWLSVVGGRFLDPYQTPTNLIFHRDLTFDGLSATGRVGLGDGSPDQSQIFFTVGGHPLQEVEFSAQDKWLAAAQLGTNLRWGEGQRLRVSGAFFDYFNVTGRLNPPAPDNTLYNFTAPNFMRIGNTVFDISNSPDPSVNLFAYASKFRLANVNATYTLPVGRYALGLTVDAVRNFGFNAAAVASKTGYYVAPRTKGYQTDISFGDPTVLHAGEWRGTVGYRYLQRDAVIDQYTDSDFHYFGGTNTQGYYLIGDVGIANRVWLRVRYLSANEIEGPIFGVDTLQFDVNTRF